MSDDHQRPLRGREPLRGQREDDDRSRDDNRYNQSPRRANSRWGVRPDGSRQDTATRPRASSLRRPSIGDVWHQLEPPQLKPGPTLSPANSMPNTAGLKPTGTHTRFSESPTDQKTPCSDVGQPPSRPPPIPALPVPPTPAPRPGFQAISVAPHTRDKPPPPPPPPLPSNFPRQRPGEDHHPAANWRLHRQPHAPPPISSQHHPGPPQQPYAAPFASYNRQSSSQWTGPYSPEPLRDDQFRFSFPRHDPPPVHPRPLHASERPLARFEPDLYRPSEVGRTPERKSDDYHRLRDLPIRSRSPPRGPRAYEDERRRDYRRPDVYDHARRSREQFGPTQWRPDPREGAHVAAREGGRRLEESLRGGPLPPADSPRSSIHRSQPLPERTGNHFDVDVRKLPPRHEQTTAQHQYRVPPQVHRDTRPLDPPENAEGSSRPSKDTSPPPSKPSNPVTEELPEGYGKTPEERARIREGLALLARYEAKQAAKKEKKRQREEMEQKYAEAVAAGQVASLKLSEKDERKLRKALKRKMALEQGNKTQSDTDMSMQKPGPEKDIEKREIKPRPLPGPRHRLEAMEFDNESRPGAELVQGQTSSMDDFELGEKRPRHNPSRTGQGIKEQQSKPPLYHSAPEIEKSNGIQRRDGRPSFSSATTKPTTMDDLKRLAKQLAKEEQFDNSVTAEEAQARRLEREKRYRAVFAADREERIRKGYPVKPYRTLEEVRKEIQERKRLQEQAEKKKKPPHIIPVPSAKTLPIPNREKGTGGAPKKIPLPRSKGVSEVHNQLEVAEPESRSSKKDVQSVGSSRRRCVSDAPVDPIESIRVPKKRKREEVSKKAKESERWRDSKASESGQPERPRKEMAKQSRKQQLKERRAAKRQIRLNELVPNAEDRAFISAQEEKNHPLGLQKAAFTKSPVHRNYVFVPRGNKFITQRIKAYTFAAQKTFYVVRDGRSTYVGYQCPISIYKRAVAHEQDSRNDRQRVRMTSTWQKARVRDAAMVLDGMFRNLPPVLNAIIISRLFDDPHRQTADPLPEQLRLAATAHLRSGFNLEAEVDRIRADMMTYHGTGAAKKNKELLDEAHHQAELARERYCKEKWAEWGAEEGTNHNTTLRFATAETFIKLARERGKGREPEPQTPRDAESEEDEEEDEDDEISLPDTNFESEVVSDSDSSSTSSEDEDEDETDYHRKSLSHSSSAASDSDSDSDSDLRPPKFRFHSSHRGADHRSSDSSSSSDSSNSSDSDASPTRHHKPIPKRRRIVTTISSDEYSSSSDSNDSFIASTPHRRALASLEQRRKEKKKKKFKVKQEPRDDDDDEMITLDTGEMTEGAVNEAAEQLSALSHATDVDMDNGMDIDVTDPDFHPSMIPYPSESPERKFAVTPSPEARKDRKESKAERKERRGMEKKIKTEIKMEDEDVEMEGMVGKERDRERRESMGTKARVKKEERLVPVMYISD